MINTHRDRLDSVIAEVAGNSELTPIVRRRSCLRGVSTLTTVALAVEIGDWHRFTAAACSYTNGFASALS